MISIIKQRKIWFTISGLLVAASIIATVALGLNFGIDFTGGSLLEIEFFVTRPDSQKINESLEALQLGNITTQPAGEKGMLLRFREVNEETHQAILNTLKEKLRPSGDEIPVDVKILEEKRFDSIGPTIGQELRQKTL